MTNLRLHRGLQLHMGTLIQHHELVEAVQKCKQTFCVNYSVLLNQSTDCDLLICAKMNSPVIWNLLPSTLYFFWGGIAECISGFRPGWDHSDRGPYEGIASWLPDFRKFEELLFRVGLVIYHVPLLYRFLTIQPSIYILPPLLSLGFINTQTLSWLFV